MKPRSELATVAPAEIVSAAETHDAHVQEFLDQSHTPNTVRAYRADITHFRAWCATHGYVSMPASVDTVSRYLSALAKGTAARDPKGPKPRSTDGHWTVATIKRRRASIGTMHELAEQLNPCASRRVAKVIEGIVNAIGEPQRAVTPLLPDQLRASVAALRASGRLRDRRDVALVLMCFSGAFRRSEIAALNVSDVRFTPEGASAFVRRSKGDRKRVGVHIPIAHGEHPETDPVATLRAWIADLPTQDGPLFYGVDQSDQMRPSRMPAAEVSRAVKRIARGLGLDPREFGGHSLRAGFVTAAFAEGRSIESVKEHVRHVRYETVSIYNRQANKFRNNPAKGLL